ncbi:phage tail protein [uncultured Pantoea sp.]|uniref:glycine-rich domain-containing protein n=1 Tax=uncultured Pantoea sp. TaxID=218084 RepID=UPI00258E709A|nr:phage tail protein [uncultured Pantoea sp.]
MGENPSLHSTVKPIINKPALAGFLLRKSMDRQIVYAGAIPLETDLLNTNKYTMIGLAKLASAIMGASTYVRGLTCSPNSPPSMVISVSPGEIYSLQNVDGTAYSSLAADTTHSILKQGLLMDAQSFTLTAPSTSGYSVNYLIQATYTDTDSGATVLPYYNASNPSVAWSGPNNSGTAQNTVRSGVCTVSLKAGVAATTGTQTTPSPDSGYIGLYVITVAQGATTVTAGNISVYANAPFLPSTGIVDGIQKGSMLFATDTGSANAYVVNLNPGISSIVAGMEVTFLASNANTSSSTLNVCSKGAFPVLNLFGATLTPGEIAANSLVKVRWSASSSSWILVNATSAKPTVPTASSSDNSTQTANTAFVQSVVNLSLQLHGQVEFTSNGTWTCPSGVTQIYLDGCAAGGGGAYSASGTTGGGGGGGGQAVTGQIITVSPGTTYSITIGAPGNGGTSSTLNGTQGGNTTFGSLLTLTGGFGGLSAGNGGAAGGTGATGGIAGNLSGGISFGGAGGSSNYGSGGPGGSGAAFGQIGGGFGSGGGGGGNGSGSRGGYGFVRIWW